MTHSQNQPEGEHRSEKSDSKVDRVEAKAENRERGEASKHIADGDLNKDIQASTLEKRLSRKSGATGYGVASADSLLPTEAEIQKMGKQLTAQLEQEKPVAVIAQNIGDNNPFQHPSPQVTTDATTATTLGEKPNSDNKLAQNWASDYSLQHAHDQSVANSHKVHDGHNAKSNDEFLDMFLAGSGNDKQVHATRGEPMLEAFIKSPGAAAIRAEYAKENNPAFTDKLGYGTVQAFKDTMLPHVDGSGVKLPDYSSPGVHVGGFGRPPKDKPEDACTATRCDADGKPAKDGDHVQFQVVNVAGEHSWFYHLPGIEDKPLGKSGERRTIVEVFKWTEPLQARDTNK